MIIFVNKSTVCICDPFHRTVTLKWNSLDKECERLEGSRHILPNCFQEKLHYLPTPHLPPLALSLASKRVRIKCEMLGIWYLAPSDSMKGN